MIGPENALLTCAQTAAADRLAIAGGTPGIVLMEAAGAAVAAAVAQRFRLQPVTVLCGPGNNGGDGWVAARVLAERGWPVRLGTLVPVAALTGDAAMAAAGWSSAVDTADAALAAGDDLVIDGLFGAGLSRPLAGVPAALVAALAGRTVVAIDLPSGIHGDTGAVLGCAPQAAVTITFFTAKPGHFLYPGRGCRGDLVIADIGIAPAVLDRLEPRWARNGPALWGAAFPRLDPTGHKYDRGHGVVVAGDEFSTGAARLAARAALRVGAGLVTTVGDQAACRVLAAHQTTVMVRPIAGADGLAALLADRRHNAVALGPGAAPGAATDQLCAAACRSGAAVVLDAGALVAAAGRAEGLWQMARGPLVLTPHDGEFRRLFPELSGSRAERALAAAAASGATVILKGPDSCIAAPDGRLAINDGAPPWLATAGTGDVLTGLVTGLLAQGMAGFAAACAAVWLHSLAASRLRRGMIAEDLVEEIPATLAAATAVVPGLGP